MALITATWRVTHDDVVMLDVGDFTDGEPQIQRAFINERVAVLGSDIGLNIGRKNLSHTISFQRFVYFDNDDQARAYMRDHTNALSVLPGDCVIEWLNLGVTDTFLDTAITGYNAHVENNFFVANYTLLGGTLIQTTAPPPIPPPVDCPIDDEGFEGSGAPDGWASFGSGANFDYTAAPITGSQSLHIVAGGGAYYGLLNNNELWLSFSIKIITLPSTASQVLFYFAGESGTTLIYNIYLNTDGKLRVVDYGGSINETTTDALSVGTVYTIWGHYKNKSGGLSNAVAEVSFDVIGNPRPDSGPKWAGSSSGIYDFTAFNAVFDSVLYPSQWNAVIDDVSVCSSDHFMPPPPVPVEYLADSYDVDPALYQFNDLLSADPSFSQTGVGQSFTCGHAGEINRARFFIKRYGLPTGHAVAKLYTHTGVYGTSSVPGTLLATSNTLNVATISPAGHYYDFTFHAGTSLTASTHYVITLEYSGGDVHNCIIPADTVTLGHAGNEVERGSAMSWASDSSEDVIFYVYVLD